MMSGFWGDAPFNDNGDCECDCVNNGCEGSITFIDYPTTVLPGQTFTVTGSFTASGSPFISVGATPYYKQRPDTLIAATVSGSNWAATFSSQYVTFHVWAEYTLNDAVYIVGSLISPETGGCCPESTSGDRSREQSFRRNAGGLNEFYYGET
jgi:hypothetical protein